jgi:predicted nucleic acid-binding protein
MPTLVDTSFIFALANQNDRSHAACADLARSISGGLVVPVTVLPEVMYLATERLGHHIMRQLVRQLTSRAWTLENLSQEDLARASAVLDRYADSSLDFVDATIVAIAERLWIRRILTLDRRHFLMIRPRHCAAFEILPS